MNTNAEVIETKMALDSDDDSTVGITVNKPQTFKQLRLNKCLAVVTCITPGINWSTADAKHGLQLATDRKIVAAVLTGDRKAAVNRYAKLVPDSWVTKILKDSVDKIDLIVSWVPEGTNFRIIDNGEDGEELVIYDPLEWYTA